MKYLKKKPKKNYNLFKKETVSVCQLSMLYRFVKELIIINIMYTCLNCETNLLKMVYLNGLL